MRPSVRLHRGSAVLALVAGASLVGGAALVGASASTAHHVTTRATTVLSSDPVVVAASATPRVDTRAHHVPNPMDLGFAGAVAAVVGLLLLAWRLATLAWSSTAFGSRGRLRGRRAPPLALV
jgi:hypothetical protein